MKIQKIFGEVDEMDFNLFGEEDVDAVRVLDEVREQVKCKQKSTRRLLRVEDWKQKINQVLKEKRVRES